MSHLGTCKITSTEKLRWMHDAYIEAITPLERQLRLGSKLSSAVRDIFDNYNMLHILLLKCHMAQINPGSRQLSRVQPLFCMTPPNQITICSTPVSSVFNQGLCRSTSTPIGNSVPSESHRQIHREQAVHEGLCDIAQNESPVESSSSSRPASTPMQIQREKGIHEGLCDIAQNESYPEFSNTRRVIASELRAFIMMFCEEIESLQREVNQIDHNLKEFSIDNFSIFTKISMLQLVQIRDFFQKRITEYNRMINFPIDDTKQSRQYLRYSGAGGLAIFITVVPPLRRPNSN